ncbi:MAG: Mrp/NBP35 family ATP-binding protein [Nitrospira sp. SB0677_bin_15]|nr:Mrp/NBP35 family ATP-binding protein [Nitrospira sp. SB0667_bin_9]MYD31528.1 Mrp/NBP35 family ATP-binding protein [Nitrospira sp. SB0661_bin_20]MYG39320.1 Mrp/NBP35 family ATP-binding protein [Nitrospira sp. SB0677_bin_15]MYJ22039.1 Mrp/NBP35 family ATP-binding protein [Nitrospira sp. SB0673_bin_12]
MSDESPRHESPGNAAAQDAVLPGVKHVIAVASGKGGVGKSTVSANLSVALAQTGVKVGLMDADIYGPNIPMMMGVPEPPEKEGDKIKPAEAHGVKVMSMGFFVPEETAIVWRGPMVHTAIQQFFRDVLWGDLDYLLVDLPPGTGDAQLSLSQIVPLTGVVTVTTPQEVALYDVRKGLMMFKKVNVPLLGVIENMSFFVCGHCGERTEIFSFAGGERAAQKFEIPFLGRIPLDPVIREGGDAGKPIVAADPKSPLTLAFQGVAGALQTRVEELTSEATGATLSDMVKKLKEPMT